jgi:hypothetical protein
VGLVPSRTILRSCKRAEKSIKVDGRPTKSNNTRKFTCEIRLNEEKKGKKKNQTKQKGNLHLQEENQILMEQKLADFEAVLSMEEGVLHCCLVQERH